MLRFSLCLLSLFLFLSGARAQTPSARRLLSVMQTGHPYSVAYSFSRCPDFDGDGVPDFLMPGDFKDSHGWRFGIVEVRSGKNGKILWEVREVFQKGGGNGFGMSVAAIGDLDGDKRPEILIGAPLTWHPGARDGGSVFLYSSRTKKVLREHKGAKDRYYYGTAIGTVADLDGDGFGDYYTKREQPSTYDFFSGRTGKYLRSFTYGKYSIGGPLSIPDLDRDGVQDLVFHAMQGCCSQGRLLVISGKTFELMKTIFGHPQGAGFGGARALVPDVNGDGIDDLIVGGMFYPNPVYFHNGYARLISLKDGKVLQEWKSPMKTLDHFGSDVMYAGDLDSDGVADITIMNGIKGKTATIQAFSGKTGKLLRIYEPIPGHGMHVWPRFLGDVNGDGVGDLAIPTLLPYPGISSVEIFSGRQVGLDANKVSLSLSKQESLAFRIDPGPLHKNKFYLLLGSLSGEQPGLQLGNHYLPLLWDPYTTLMLSMVNSSLLSRSFLPFTGAATTKAFLNMLPGMPTSLIGRDFHHAFLIWNPKTATIDFTSNAVKTRILK